MVCPWGVPTIPKVLCKSVELLGRSGVGFGRVDPRTMFIPRAQVLTGLTVASHRSDWCRLLVKFCSGERLGEFPIVLCCRCFEFGSVWSSGGQVGRFGISRPIPVWPVSCTGLTGAGAFLWELPSLSRVTRLKVQGDPVRLWRVSGVPAAQSGRFGVDRYDRCKWPVWPVLVSSCSSWFFHCILG
jgi:hypothetical protein